MCRTKTTARWLGLAALALFSAACLGEVIVQGDPDDDDALSSGDEEERLGGAAPSAEDDRCDEARADAQCIPSCGEWLHECERGGPCPRLHGSCKDPEARLVAALSQCMELACPMGCPNSCNPLSISNELSDTCNACRRQHLGDLCRYEAMACRR